MSALTAPARRTVLRVLAALLGALVLSTGAGVLLWSSRASGELRFEPQGPSVCFVDEIGDRRSLDCVSLNAFVAAPFALAAGLAAFLLAWRPHLRGAAWTAITTAIMGAAAVTLADLGTIRSDWLFVALTTALALVCWWLLREGAQAASGARS